MANRQSQGCSALLSWFFEGLFMIRVFRTTDVGIQEFSNIEAGSWIAMTAPTTEELRTIADRFRIDLSDLKSPLDEEERSRIEAEDHYTFLILDIPTSEERNGRDFFVTIPVGIFYVEDVLITVCLEDTPLLTVFMDGRVRNASTLHRTRFLYQMLYRNATMYLQFLRVIDKRFEEIEAKLQVTMRNEELIEMLDLEKSLVYLSTSLRGNEVVLERMKRASSIQKTEDEMDILEDVIVENKQAIEMAKIYSDILNGTMDAYANIINNNMNTVMRFLSIITVVLTVPTIITGAIGMNLRGIPFAEHEQGFWLMMLCILIATIAAGIYIGRSKRLK